MLAQNLHLQEGVAFIVHHRHVIVRGKTRSFGIRAGLVGEES
jgi:hypothetical protein